MSPIIADPDKLGSQGEVEDDIEGVSEKPTLRRERVQGRKKRTEPSED